jgi:hypothetical protein
VHLTYSSGSGNASPKKVPHTVFYSSLDDWLRRGMAADHADYLSGEVPENEGE